MGVRAWTPEPETSDDTEKEDNEIPARKPGRPNWRRYPHEALVFDTETRDEPGQRLLFGVWRLYVDNLDTDTKAAPASHLVEEGIFYPDARSRCLYP